MELTLGGKTYTLAANLRVAYNVQGQHNHRSYMEIFKEVDSMPIEDQIGIIYEAAKVGSNGNVPSRADFLSAYLDDPNASIVNMMKTLKQIYEGIVGQKLEAPEENTDNQESTESVGE